MKQTLPIAGTNSCTMYEDRFCEKCDQVCEGGEPDACLGYISGVSHACCGRGIDNPYVVIGGSPNQNFSQIEYKTTLRGDFATRFFEIVRDSAPYRAAEEELYSRLAA